MRNDYEVYADESAHSSTNLQRFFSTVYLWMFLGLGISSVTALAVNYVPALEENIQMSGGMTIFLLIAYLALPWVIQGMINRISAATGLLLFFVFSAVTGAFFSGILKIYAQADIVSAFIVSAAMFGGLSVFGFVTKADLSGMGRFLIMAVWGLLIASVVNWFMGSAQLSWMITYGAVLIFSGLTVYDTNKLRDVANQVHADSDIGKKVAIIGALHLYIDFIMIFIHMLRIMGRRN
ncbi:MAG: Bax inhibitor-1/YccA family protein [Planctomycetes bacterium]|nr:Bax inhibitor-1/YccA family protein [Planctomycetota bacterium]